jgi:NAD(P)-dependent dehydrogenase (short-subunit alcohol dehydrogenase family)
MVANAGVFDDYRLVEDTSPELWERTIAINLTGVFYCYKRALKEMLPAFTGASSIWRRRLGSRETVAASRTLPPSTALLV